MIDLKYTITKFDNTNKILVVTFQDGEWAEIRLTNPLPKNISELENIIKRFSAPKEAIEASQNPDTDLSYIDSLVGQEKITTRYELNPAQKNSNESMSLDPEAEANLLMLEEIEFQKRIGDALVKFGIVSSNPAII